MTQVPRVLAIVGPTASGKSAVADLVAHDLGTSQVSVDAMQVYRGMDVGTAKTPVSERHSPLLMVDVADPSEDFSAARFQLAARAEVDRLLARGKVPVLCGGTGLYLDAVIDQMDFPSGDVSSPSRARYARIADEEGADALHALLEERDPASARLIHPHNVRRVQRALEMCDEGRSYAAASGGLHDHQEHYHALIVGLMVDRRDLRRRIDGRVDAMFASGLVDEVHGLAERGLTPDSTAGQAIGYKEVLAYLAGTVSLPVAVELVKTHTRQYAKRQLTWFRRDGRVRWVDVGDRDARSLASEVCGMWGEGR